MDFLQIALIFLIILLSIFLAITGFQVFLILRDLKKALDRLNKILQAGENVTESVEKPIAQVAKLVSVLTAKPKRFYKRTL